jgi:hypothetical protein
MRALEKAPEQRFQDLADMRSAIIGGQAGPEPEDDRTVRIHRPGTPDASPAPESEQIATVLTGIAQFGDTGVEPVRREERNLLIAWRFWS